MIAGSSFIFTHATNKPANISVKNNRDAASGNMKSLEKYVCSTPTVHEDLAPAPSTSEIGMSAHARFLDPQRFQH